jgi:phage recombination protein Bet
MSMVQTEKRTDNASQVARQQVSAPAIGAPRLPYHPLAEERFGIDRASWKALVEAIFPNATSVESVILALSYCRARKLDPFKRNVHIVPIWDKTRQCMTDTIWPGIGELRTTAFRTGEYAGRGETVFGPDVKMKVGSLELIFPEWAQVSVFRMVKGQRVEFAGPRVYWLETYATIKRNDETPNDMWAGRPRGQLDKCAEAAALRAGFPEEIGSDYIPEEVQSRAANRLPKIIEAEPIKPTGTKSEQLAAMISGAPEEATVTVEPDPVPETSQAEQSVENPDNGTLSERGFAFCKQIEAAAGDSAKLLSVMQEVTAAYGGRMDNQDPEACWLFAQLDESIKSCKGKKR